MRYQSFALVATTLLSGASAFPRMDAEQLKSYQEASKRSAEPAACPYAKREAMAEADPGCPFAKMANKFKRSTFSAEQQRIRTDGEHAFVPPNFSGGDQRGPCPGLNALANHNYLPRSGVADMQTIIRATNEVYGMSLDLGGFLAVYGTVFDGNPLSTSPGYSIGGPTKDSQNILNGVGLLGTPSGLSGSHNKYESDVSATRGDLYLTGNNFHVVKDRFVDYYYALKPDTPAPEQYTALAPFHKQRYDESLMTNPYFFYSPFAGILVSPAAYSFPPRMMANHSEEYPEGYLDRETFSSFFGVDTHQSTDPNDFEVKQGWERIPDNWYKRPIDDEFSIPDFLLDVVQHAEYDPRLLSFGGNTNGPNTFAGLDIGDLTGGVLNFANLLDPNNLLCVALQIAEAAAPDVLGSLYTDVKKAMTPLTDKIAQLLANKACPQLQKINSELFEQYPGYTESYGSYAGLSEIGTNPVGGVVEGVTGIVGGLIPTGQKE
jgi:hypothetical protein